MGLWLETWVIFRWETARKTHGSLPGALPSKGPLGPGKKTVLGELSSASQFKTLILGRKSMHSG